MFKIINYYITSINTTVVIRTAMSGVPTLNYFSRTNGFTPFTPLNWWQITSFIAFAIFNCGFYIIFAPVLEDTFRTISLIVYSFMSIMTFYTAFLATTINPADLLSFNVDREALDSSTRADMRAKQIPGQRWCSVCNHHVYLQSKHCRACDKCVQGFDHHCRWLNNCVGEKNYREFFGALCSVLGLTTFELALAIWLLALSTDDTDAMLDRLFYQLDTQSFRTILVVYLCLLIPFVGALGIFSKRYFTTILTFFSMHPSIQSNNHR